MAASGYCRFEDHHYDRDNYVWVKVEGQQRMCPDKDCKYVHRVERAAVCPHPDTCIYHQCRLLHSRNRPKPCRLGADCGNEQCKFNHPANRKQICPQGSRCYRHAAKLQGQLTDDMDECHLAHPSRMIYICRYNDECRLSHCTFLHHPRDDREAMDMPKQVIIDSSGRNIFG